MIWKKNTAYTDKLQKNIKEKGDEPVSDIDNSESVKNDRNEF